MKINLFSALLITASFFLISSHKADAQTFFRFDITFYGDFYPDPLVKFCEGCELSTIGQNAVYDKVYNMRDYPKNKAQPHLGDLNDRIKSMKFTANRGDVIRIFNNADADYSGGSCIVTIKQDVQNYYLDSFQKTYEDNYVKVQWWTEQQKLNGKVSSFIVDKARY